MRILRWTCVPALLLAACGGGGAKNVAEPEPVAAPKPAPKPPPPPPPVCVQGAGGELALIGMADADDGSVSFCVTDGAELNTCYAVDLASKTYRELDDPPRGQQPALDPDPARVETTPTEVKVCVGDECKTVKPKVPRSENPIDAVVNAEGTHVAVLLGNAEKGKGTVELYEVAKGKKLGVPIKYAKGDYKCGEARMLGTTLYLSASVCAGPAARAWLFDLKGKKIADVGGRDFGTYGTVPVQVGDRTWAFLDENATAIVVQDVVKGTIVKTIDVSALWGGDDGGDDEAPAPAMGNPGESALVRGADGSLLVITGGPAPGSVGIVDVEAGELTGLVAALACAG